MSASLYCPCGYRYDVEHRFNGTRFVRVYYDHQGIEISRCPWCGKIVTESVNSWELEGKNEAILFDKHS